MQKQRSKRRTGFVHNGATSRKTLDATPLKPSRPGPAVRNEGTVKAQLIGKLGTRGYGRLLGQLRDQAGEP